ncbi:UBE2Q2L isoform 2 [Pongo abelii]|uniref:UBE2Q2L isoform 2 n=1 Tax=Pongo abelii TaxID=9601 RepID=A0A2J8SG41_PONAB|nr:UBE2Q2L isoform 2 [Pongo abelii]
MGPTVLGKARTGQPEARACSGLVHPPGVRGEGRIVPWMQQESCSSSSPIWFVDSDEPNLTSLLERLEDTKDNISVRKEAKLFSLFLMNIIFRT